MVMVQAEIRCAREMRRSGAQDCCCCSSSLPSGGLRSRRRGGRQILFTRKEKHIRNFVVSRGQTVEGHHSVSWDGNDELLGRGDSDYDPVLLDEYFQKRPVLVTRRVVDILAASLKGLALVGTGILPREKQLSACVDIIEGLGPAFMKIAQTLSTRPDLIGEDLASELGTLQDRAQPFSNRVAFQMIEEELGRPLQDVFDEIGEVPVAAASFGQVYRASLSLSGGEEEEREEGKQRHVAVKVQRPNAHQSIAVDIFILRLVLSLVKKATGMTRDLRLIADEVGAGLFSELDYRGEAQNALTFAQAHNKLDYVIVPKPLLGLTTRRVLTMEWIEGSSPAALFEELDREEKERRKPVSASARREEIEEGEGSRAKLKQMVNMGVACSLNQLLSTGVMHADPHPGNLLFTAEGKLAYVDFGLLTRVTPQHRYGMLSSILHMSSGDWEGFVGDMDTMELLKPTVSKRELATDLHERMGESSFNNFKKLLKVMAALGLKYKFTLPPYYVLVVRSLATLEGIALQVDSDFKIVSAAVPQALYIILNSTERNGSSFGSDLLEDFLLKPSGLLQEERISKVLDVLKDKNQPTNRGLLLLGGKEPKRGGLRWKTYLGKWCDVFKSASSALRGRPLALLHFWYISIRTVSLLLVQKFIHKMMIFFVKSERE